MRVKMRVGMATPKQTAAADEIIEVSEKDGKEMVAGGYAVAVRDKVTAPSMADLQEAQQKYSDTERAAIEPPETPEEPVRKRRGRPAG